MNDSKPTQQATFREAFAGSTLEEKRMNAQRAAYAKAGFKSKKNNRVWA